MGTATLVDTTEFSTTIPEAAREFLSEVYGDSRLRVDQLIDGDEVLRVTRTQTPLVSLSQVTVPAELEMHISGRRDEVLFSVIHEGQAEIDRHGLDGEPMASYGPGDVAVGIQPGAEWTHRTHPSKNTSIGVAQSLLRRVSGSDPADVAQQWRSRSGEPLTGRAGIWRDASEFVTALLTEPSAASAPLVVGPAERLVAAAALTVFPNNLVGEQTMTDRLDAHPETLRRAIAFIEANPQMDISAADLARAAHASPRAVQLAFRRQLDTTPTAYLRSVRLHHARQELLAAEPGTKVTEIALRWGFAGPSRFAEYYRREYGEKPSETLRR